MYMAFELNEDEIAQLNSLDAEKDRRLAEIDNQYPDPEDSTAKSQAEIELYREYDEIGFAIRRKARERSLRYYASHVSELITALQEDLRYRAKFLFILESSDKHLRPLDRWKKNSADSIAQYLALLNDDEHSAMLKYIDYVFDNREKIYRDFQKAIHKGQKGRTGYAKMLNGPGVNNGLRASKRRMKRKDNIKAGELKIIGEQDIDGVHIELSNFDRLSLTDTARKLFHILATKLTKQIPYLATAEQILKGRRVCLSLDEYMSLCGLTDRKEARKQMINSFEALYNLSLEWDEKSKIIDPETGKRKYRKTHWKARLIDKQGIEEAITDGGITVYFPFEIAEYLSQAYIMQINLQALTIDTNKFRHAYALAIKLYTHYYQNAGKYKHVRLSVESLLKACPEMPRPEEVSERHYKRQIIDPFETNIDALQEAGIIASWHYCNSGGEPLTDEQLRDYDFNDWLNWLVEYTLPADCPEPPKPKPHKPKKNTKPKAIALPAKSE